MTTKNIMARSAKSARRKADGPRLTVTRVKKVKEMGAKDKYRVTTRKSKVRRKK